MRVLIINTVPTGRNGITNVIFNLLQYMPSIEADYVSINLPQDRYVGKIKKNNGNVFIINRNLRKIFSYIKSLKNYIKNGNYDIVHIHGNSHTVAVELVAAKLGGCKTRIVHAHSTKCNSLFTHKILTPIFNILCTHRLACGVDAGRFMYGKHYFRVVNNGIDTGRFSFRPDDRIAIREKYDVSKKFVIGHVGGFVEEKNQAFLLDVVYRLRELDDRYCLMLIGEGALMCSVKEKAVRLGIENAVMFVGGTDNVPQYLSAMDLIMMPSLFEGLPLTLIEEQANGLNCLVSDNITKEVDKTGNVSFLSLESINEWIDRTLSMEINEDREKVGRIAIEKIKAHGYDIQNNAEDLQRYYYEICKGVVGR